MECLVEKIKAEVSNNNLPIIDTVRLFVNTSVSAGLGQNNRCFRMQPQNDGVKVKAVGGFICDSDGSNQEVERTITGGEQNVYFTSGVTELLVSKKANIKAFKTYTNGANTAMCSIKLEDLKGLTILNDLNIGGLQNSGKVKSFVDGINPAIKSLWLNNTNIEGDINDFAGLTGLLSLVIPSSNIKGDLESLAVNHVAGSMTFQCAYQCVKYQGQYLGVSSHTVVFDGQGGITSVS